MNKHITKIYEHPNKHWDEMKKNSLRHERQNRISKETLNIGKIGNVKLKN